MDQPDQYKPRLSNQWMDFPSSYFHVHPSFLRQSHSHRTKWTSIGGRWPGSRLQVAALSWPDGRVWTITDGLRRAGQP